jgi:excisionase family DNA binding protein
MAIDAPPGYITVAEAAGILGISTQITYSLVYQGRLPHLRRVNRVFVEEAAVMRRATDIARRRDCLRIDEVAEFFGVHEETVRTWHARRLLHTEKIANKLCFDLAEVVAFIPPGGRPSANAPTRTIRGRYYPPPPGSPNPTEGTS